MADQKATLKTNRGDIVINLFPNPAPETVDNFVGLAEGTKEYSGQNASGTESGPFYDEAVFHRIIAGFMIQGGDPLGTGTGGPGYNFEDEFDKSLGHDKAGILSMANAGPRTNGSQFFITHGATPHLNGKHTVFGAVVSAEDQKVVDSIAKGDVIEKLTIEGDTTELMAKVAEQVTKWNQVIDKRFPHLAPSAA